MTLLRDGREVAHNRLDSGHIAPGHFQRQALTLFYPHERQNAANARVFTLEDWLVDGRHEVRDMVPRLAKKNMTVFQAIETTWIADR